MLVFTTRQAAGALVPGGYRAARGGSRLVEHNQKETPSEFAPVRVPRAYLLWAAAASLLEVIADDAPRRFECLRTRLGARPRVGQARSRAFSRP